MRRRHLNSLIFLFIAISLVCRATYIQHQAVLRQERMDLLFLEIDTLTESYETQIEGLTLLYDDTTRELPAEQSACKAVPKCL